MDKKFELPVVQVVTLDAQDIIVTSGCDIGPGGLEIN